MNAFELLQRQAAELSKLLPGQEVWSQTVALGSRVRRAHVDELLRWGLVVCREMGGGNGGRMEWRTTRRGLAYIDWP